MLLYIASTPLNKLDLKQRVSGWYFIPLERKAKEAWKAMLAPLKDKGIERVFSSDLDQEAANLAGNELHIPVSTDFSFRRYNFGRHHATKLDSVTDILQKLEGKWKTNADIPIKGGDSLTSFNKRFARRFNCLLSATGTGLFISDPLTIGFVRDGMTAHALIPNGNMVKRDKIYKVQSAGTSA
jgi:broad specificity phosphatase PhoE